MTGIALRVEAPLVTFRNPHAREFAESYRVPPPSTVYGMLLSMVGEEHRSRHAGVKLAIASLSVPSVSVVLRTVWRVKNIRTPLGTGENRRMDFQQVLSDVRAAVWVDSSGERAPETLATRLRTALVRPSEVVRFGALALGESRDLVDVVEELVCAEAQSATWLLPDAEGNTTLPIWPDHVGSAKTRWGRFRLEERALVSDAPSEAFFVIAPPTS